MSERLRLDQYVHALRLLAAFHYELEPSIDRFGSRDIAFVPRASRLHEDLRHFAVTPMQDVAFPEVLDLDAAFGAAYVLQGASLGGRVIEPHVRSVLGLESRGTRYFVGSDATIREWDAFRRSLNQYVERHPKRLSTIQESAHETFVCLNRAAEKEPATT